MADLYKYGVATHLYKPVIKRGVVDFAVGADWTPAAGDVKISKDGGAAANVTNLPTAITMGNTVLWDFSITATEMQAAKVRITIADATTKAVEDVAFEIDTYGNASAEHAADLDNSTSLGLTNLDATISSRASQTSLDTLDDIVDTEIADIQARLPAVLVSGRIKAIVEAFAANVIDDNSVAADMDSYSGKIWIIKQSTTKDEYGVAFYKNNQPIETGITVPLIDYIKKLSDGTILINDASLTDQSNGDYYYGETTNKLVAGNAYMARVTATIDGATRFFKQQIGRDSV